MLHIQSVCASNLVIQHAKRMRRIIVLSITCAAPPYFSTFSHKLRDFRKKVIELKTRVLVLSTNFFVKHFSL